MENYIDRLLKELKYAEDMNNVNFTKNLLVTHFHKMSNKIDSLETELALAIECIENSGVDWDEIKNEQ